MEMVNADEAGLQTAVRILTGGGVAVIPTDTVYGLAAHPDFPAAVDRLYAIKVRDARKPIALLAADAESARKYLGDAPARLGAKYWPGALTVVAGGEGVRVPDYGWTRRLLAECGGALRVTSANISGGRPATGAGRALAEVGLSADLVVDDGASPGGKASTVVAVDETGELKILRDGPVKFLTLASGSPRRAKILSAHGVDFTVVKSDAPEISLPEDPERTVRDNALAKGSAVGGSRVLSADTIVWMDGRIYGKPRDLAEAGEFLRTLGGREHVVYTGVAYNGEVRICRSFVRIRKLDDAAIAEYLARVNPVDRAGAYDIDASGDLVVESYRGSYENIMGLPLEPLREWGIVR